MIKALVIDDEASTLNVIRILIERHIPEITELHTAAGSQEGFNAIQHYKPDLVFLDIQMPVMNGFELLEKFYPDPLFNVIFVTAYDQYAIKAIKFSAIDYLVKPVDIEELKMAVQRYISRRYNQKEMKDTIQNFISNIRSEQKDFKLALSTTEGTFFYKPSDIIRCEADTNYTRFFFTNNKKLLTSKTLKEYEELLSGHDFLRVHKSHLVNRIYVRGINSDHEIVLSDQTTVEISRRKFPEIKKALKM